MTTNNCGTCTFKKEAETDAMNIRADKSLRCTRYPPTVFLMVSPRGEQLLSSQFPVVTAQMGCGEYVGGSA